MAADVLTPRVARASAAILLSIYVNSSSLDGKYVRRDKHFLFPHDDVIKWKHFPRYWPFVRGIHRSPVNSPHIGQWRGALMFSFISVWINGWVNNCKAGDLRRYRAHCDVTVMIESKSKKSKSKKILFIVGTWMRHKWSQAKMNEAEWRIYASVNQVATGSDNGLSPVRRQVIIWTNAGILSIGTLAIARNFNEILIEMQTFSSTKMQFKRDAI